MAGIATPPTAGGGAVAAIASTATVALDLTASELTADVQEESLGNEHVKPDAAIERGKLAAIGTGLRVVATDAAGLETVSTVTEAALAALIGGQVLVAAGTSQATPPLAFAGDANTGARYVSADLWALLAGGADALLLTASGILVPAGTSLSTPPIGFVGDPNTGVRWISTDLWALLAGGADALQVGAGYVLHPAGTSQATPPIGFVGDPNTGIRWISGDVFALVAGAVDALQLTATGILVPNGTSQATPPLAFQGDPNTGARWISADLWALLAGGADALQLTASGILVPAGSSQATPPLGFVGDPNTGVRWISADLFALVAGGSDALQLTASGLLVPAGTSQATPPIGFVGDPNTGARWISADLFALEAGGADALQLTSTGPLLPAGTSSSTPPLAFIGDPNTGRRYISADYFADLAGGVDVALFRTVGGVPELEVPRLRVSSALLGIREVLTANRTYYVRTDGSDSNDGLANTSGGAFLTWAAAINRLYTLEQNGYTVTIQIGNGTYTAAVDIFKPFSGPVSIQGDAVTPSNVLLSVTGADAFTVRGAGVELTIGGFKVQTATAGSAITARYKGRININNKMDFGAVPIGYSQLYAFYEGQIYVTAGYTISAGSFYHILSQYGGVLHVAGLTITFTGGHAFTNFCSAYNGTVIINGCTFSGTLGVTGTRYSAVTGGFIETAGGGASYLPGSVAGSVSSGGVYN